MITVLGLGFVGLTTALGFSKKGFKVYGYDIQSSQMDELRKARIPFLEPGLDVALREELSGNFQLPETLQEAVVNSTIIFLCVGTPSTEDGSADLSYLKQAIKDVVAVNDPRPKTIVIKSTVPPTTISKTLKPFLLECIRDTGHHISLASNPEFLREGTAWFDFMNPDRIVIGVDQEDDAVALKEIYHVFNAPVHIVNTNTAEYIKYLSNTLLSTLISYANEMAMVADAVGDVDVYNAFSIVHEDRRWSGSPAPMAKYVYPGAGYGGYCLPKDTAALNAIARQNGFVAEMLRANLVTNEKVKDFVVNKITSQCKPDSTIGILGLSFKPDSDDVRLSPSKSIIERLLAAGYNNIIGYDPAANDTFHNVYRLPITYASSLEDIVEKADVLTLLTSWNQFKQNEALLRRKPLFDFRYVWPLYSKKKKESVLL